MILLCFTTSPMAWTFFFFWLDWSLNSGFHACKVLYHLSHTSRPFCSGYFGDGGVGLTNYLPRLAYNHNLPARIKEWATGAWQNKSLFKGFFFYFCAGIYEEPEIERNFILLALVKGEIKTLNRQPLLSCFILLPTLNELMNNFTAFHTHKW
jgi:hypothetical protein